MKKALFIGIGVLILVGGVGFFLWGSDSDTPTQDADPITAAPATDTQTAPPQAAMPPGFNPDEPYVDPFPDDQDRDGLTTEQEAELGTSDTQYDTDGDGLSDASETTRWQTDPLRADTDGDGFMDGWEVLQGYNPAGDGRL